MSNQEVAVAQNLLPEEVNPENVKQFVTMNVGGQLFGIPVLKVQDVLRPHKITPVPLSDPMILGSINLRGRIVTVVDMRRRLNVTNSDAETKEMQVVVYHKDDLYAMVVDSVGEVMSLPLEKFEQNPSNLDDNWREVSLGVYRLEDRLMVVLDIASILKY